MSLRVLVRFAGLVECAERYLHKEMTKKTLRLCCGTWGAQNEGG